MEHISIKANDYGIFFQLIFILMDINLRIKEVREGKKLNKVQFSALIGIDNSQYSKIESGKLQPTINQVMEISSKTDTDLNWLLAGKGQMTTENYPQPMTKNKIPFYETDVTAGDVSFFDAGDVQPNAYMDIPGLVADAIVAVRGHSMHDVICNGDWIAVRHITDFSFFTYGLKYLVVTKEQRLVKYIRKHEKPDFLLLTSHNKEFDPIDMPIKNILKLFVVVDIFKHETM